MRAIPLITVLFAAAYFVGLVYEHEVYERDASHVVGSVSTPSHDMAVPLSVPVNEHHS